MNQDALIQLCNMSCEELIKEANKNNYNGKELEAFNKGKEMLDKISELSDSKASERVAISLIAYTFYKMRGGK